MRKRIVLKQVLYEDMKRRVENMVAKGSVGVDEYKRSEVFKTWTQGFTALDHPAVIQVDYHLPK